MSGISSSRTGRARLGAVGFTLIAIVLALAAAFLLARLMKGRGYDQDALQKIVVAKEKLQPGTRILASQLQMKLWPKKSIPQGAYKSMKKLLASDRKVPLHTIMAGEPMIAGRLSEASRGSGMAPLVPKNLRAFPVKIDRWVAASKMLYPGALVDVMSTTKLKDTGYTSRLILQNVKVLAVNGAVDGLAFTQRRGGKKKKRSARRGVSVATLLLTPDQAEQMALATRIGKIDFVLRGATDGATVETEGANLRQLFNLPEPISEDEEQLDGTGAPSPGTATSRAKPAPAVAPRPKPAAKRRRRRPRSRGRKNQLRRRPKAKLRRAPRRQKVKKPSTITVGGSQ